MFTSLIPKEVVAKLRIKPRHITIEQDVDGKKWPIITLQYLWEGQLKDYGNFLHDIARDLEAAKIIATAFSGSVARPGSTLFGTTEIDTTWTAWVKVELDSHTRIDIIQARMAADDAKRHP